MSAADMPVRSRSSKDRNMGNAKSKPVQHQFPNLDPTELDSGYNIPHIPLGSFTVFAGDNEADGHGDEEAKSQLLNGSQDDHRDGGADGRGLEGDYTSVAILLFLYVLQGIPLGLAGSMPLILQNRKISYSQQGMFSFVYWPFSLKLLWAPVVDTIFFERFGRRKSWLVPTQYLIGIFMIVLSTLVNSFLGNDGKDPNVFMLTALFFVLNFLASTQDIAVDGWALTMLSRRNVGYASTCNTVGQTAGYFLGNVVFLALESADFCNKYLRSTPSDEGIVTLSSFLFFWGGVFLVTTTLVAIFKHEGVSSEGNELDLGIAAMYKLLVDIIRLPAVKTYAIVLLTNKIGFAAADAVTGLKLVAEGVPKEDLAMLAIPMVPLQIILPWLISKHTSGPRPMTLYLKAFPYRLVMGLEFAVIVFVTPYMKNADGSFPAYYYALLLISYGLHQVCLYSMFVSGMAFTARVSDPVIGGTYMTLLNTLSNLGGNWPTTLMLWLVDPLTFKTCSDAKPEDCSTWLDGYYIQSVFCFLFGFGWWLLRRNSVQRLQRLPMEAWRISS